MARYAQYTCVCPLLGQVVDYPLSIKLTGNLFIKKKWDGVIGIMDYLHYFNYAVIVTVSFIDRG
jgi:hypothetical protein